MSKKKIYIGIFLILLLAASLFLLIYTERKPRMVSRSFEGGLLSIQTVGETETLLVKGSLLSDKNPEIIHESREMTISMDKDTKITRIVVMLPSEEELAKTGGHFEGSTLKRESSTGSLDTLKQDFSNDRTLGVNISANSEDNIYYQNSFVATEIKYEVVQ